MKLNEVRPGRGAVRKRRRVGRGTGSGHGTTAGHGTKGQQARSGSSKRKSFEGGQMKLTRRIPKFGFKNPSRIEFQAINVRVLQEHYEDGETVDANTLGERGLLHKKYEPVKVLGDGDLSKRLTVRVDAVSQSARGKIEGAGGSVEIETGNPRQKRARERRRESATEAAADV